MGSPSDGSRVSYHCRVQEEMAEATEKAVAKLAAVEAARAAMAEQNAALQVEAPTSLRML